MNEEGRCGDSGDTRSCTKKLRCQTKLPEINRMVLKICKTSNSLEDWETSLRITTKDILIRYIVESLRKDIDESKKWRQDATKFPLKNGEVESWNESRWRLWWRTRVTTITMRRSKRVNSRDYVWDAVTKESIRTRMIAILGWERRSFQSDEKEKISEDEKRALPTEWRKIRKKRKSSLRSVDERVRKTVRIADEEREVDIEEEVDRVFYSTDRGVRDFSRARHLRRSNIDMRCEKNNVLLLASKDVSGADRRDVL